MKANRGKSGSALDLRFAEAWERFFQAVLRRRGREAQKTGRGMSLAQYQLCTALRDGPLPVGAAAVAAGIAAPTATRMVERLYEQGLVDRHPNAEDRRVVAVSLTRAGRRALERKDIDVAAVRARIAAALTNEERELAVNILMRLAQVVDEV